MHQIARCRRCIYFEENPMNRIPKLAALACAMAVATAVEAQNPLGSGFTYQGQLKQSGAAFDGTADFTFKLFSGPTGGTQSGSTFTAIGASVTEGLLALEIDFGIAVFDGSERWLEIAVHAPSNGGAGPYTTLVPRQKLTAAPYALRALNASISGVQPNQVNLSNPNNVIAGSSLNVASGTLFVDPASQRVGIGTTSPFARAHIETASESVGLWIENTTSSPVVDTAIYGVARDYGGFFHSLTNGSDAIGVYGLASLSSGINYGVLGRSMSPNGFAGYFDGQKTFVSQRLGVGTENPTHQVTISASDSETLRLIGPSSGYGYGSRLNFGDGDYAFIEEDDDDKLRIHANRIALTAGYVCIGTTTPDPLSNFQVSGPAGNNTVMLPGNSIAKAEILDEPGLSSSLRLDEVSGDLELTTSITAIRSLEIYAPGPGYIMAFAFADSRVWGTSNYNYTGADFAISASSTAMPQELFHVVHTGGYADDPHIPISLHTVFPVNGSGFYTYHFIAKQLGGPPMDVADARLTLLYIPSAYGAVAGDEPAAAPERASAPESAMPAANEDLRAEVAELRRLVQQLLEKQREK